MPNYIMKDILTSASVRFSFLSLISMTLKGKVCDDYNIHTNCQTMYEYLNALYLLCTIPIVNYVMSDFCTKGVWPSPFERNRSRRLERYGWVLFNSGWRAYPFKSGGGKGRRGRKKEKRVKDFNHNVSCISRHS